MNDLTRETFAGMTDLACVKTDTEISEIEKMAELANIWNFAGVYALPAHNEYLKSKLKEGTRTFIGGAVGFPSGGSTTEMKVYETKKLTDFGCLEIDMVVNITWLKAGMFDEYMNDIKSVVAAAGGKTVKAIVEVHYLNDSQLFDAAKLAAECGVSFVKTATGWAESGATVSNIEIIKSAVEGTDCRIKAAGGIKDLKTAKKMIELGVSRFGLSLNSAENIINGF